MSFLLSWWISLPYSLLPFWSAISHFWEIQSYFAVQPNGQSHSSWSSISSVFLSQEGDEGSGLINLGLGGGERGWNLAVFLQSHFGIIAECTSRSPGLAAWLPNPHCRCPHLCTTCRSDPVGPLCMDLQQYPPWAQASDTWEVFRHTSITLGIFLMHVFISDNVKLTRTLSGSPGGSPYRRTLPSN